MQIYVSILISQKWRYLGGAPDDQGIVDEIVRILRAFACIKSITNKSIEIVNYIKITDKIREEAISVLNDHAKKNIRIIRIINALEKTINGEYIAIFLTDKQLTDKSRVQIEHELHTINNVTEQCENGEDLFRIFDTYDVTTYIGDRARIFDSGSGDLRRCRYCYQTLPDVTFRTKSHLIPEGLGNKQLVCKDECDSCNTYFGKTIDTDIIHYLSFFRTIYGVKCRSGTPVLTGPNFSIYNENGNVAIKVKEEAPFSENDLLSNVNLKYGANISLQNIYRSLCKYAIGTLDTKSLGRFKKTIEWIRYNKHADLLPRIAKIISYAHFSKFPKLFVYKRKIKNKSLPLVVGEFHFTCLVFVYIVPTFDSSERDYCIEANYAEFWNHFTQTSRLGNWSFEDMSPDIPNEFPINLTFTQNDTT